MRKLYAAAALWLASVTLLTVMPLTGTWPQHGPLSWLPAACGGAAIFLITMSLPELRRLRQRLRRPVITRICPQCLTPSCGCECPLRITIRARY